MSEREGMIAVVDVPDAGGSVRGRCSSGGERTCRPDASIMGLDIVAEDESEKQPGLYAPAKCLKTSGNWENLTAGSSSPGSSWTTLV